MAEQSKYVKNCLVSQLMRDVAGAILARGRLFSLSVGLLINLILGFSLWGEKMLEALEPLDRLRGNLNLLN